jgi:hypothetical protein
MHIIQEKEHNAKAPHASNQINHRRSTWNVADFQYISASPLHRGLDCDTGIAEPHSPDLWGLYKKLRFCFERTAEYICFSGYDRSQRPSRPYISPSAMSYFLYVLSTYVYMSTRAHQSIHPPIGIFPHTFHLDCIVRFVLHMSASPYKDFIHPAPQTFFSALPSISHPRRSHSPTIVEVFSTLSKD